MAYDYLDITNEVIARMNEVALTTVTFLTARGFQIQCKNAVNDSINYINQREFGWPFTHTTDTSTLIPGTTRYTAPTNTQSIDYDTFRISKNSDIGTSGSSLRVLDYKEYVQKFISQEDDVTNTTLNGGLTNNATTITVVSTAGFFVAGNIQIENETITYTGITNTTFTISSGNAAGLKVKYSGLGADATIYYGQSLIEKLTSFLTETLNTSKGQLSTRETTINKEVNDQSELLIDLNTQMESLRSRYLQQFTSMEQAVTSLKSTGEYLTNLFTAMNKDD